MNPILLVDDNEQILDILSEYVANQSWPYVTARTGEEALDLFTRLSPSVVLLDIMLPGIDGLTVCRRIRQTSGVPIIMITAKDEDADRILGLDVGADDYVVKPFSPGEVMARIRAILRRIAPAEKPRTITLDSLCINPDTRSVTVDGVPVSLTRLEIELLMVMARSPGRVFTRDQLLNLVWGVEYAYNYRAVDSQIKRLRQKLDSVPHKQFEIATVWGSGYRLERKDT